MKPPKGEFYLNYYQMLYDSTAMLLLYTSQMTEYPYSTITARYMDDMIYHFPADSDTIEKYICVMAILLSLSRNGHPVYKSQLDTLEKIIGHVPEKLPDVLNATDYSAFLSDLKEVLSMIQFYRTTEGKLIDDTNK